MTLLRSLIEHRPTNTEPVFDHVLAQRAAMISARLEIHSEQNMAQAERLHELADQLRAFHIEDIQGK